MEGRGEIKLAFSEESEPLFNEDAVAYAVEHNLTDKSIDELFNKELVILHNWLAIVLIDKDGNAVDDLATAGNYDDGLSLLDYCLVHEQLKLDNWTLEFEGGKATEVTDFAMKYFGENFYQPTYSRIFVTPDVHDFHVHRIMPNTNEDFEREEGVFMLEWEKHPMDYKAQKLDITKLYFILEKDSMNLENWDCLEFHDENDIIEEIDGGWGILNLKE